MDNPHITDIWIEPEQLADKGDATNDFCNVAATLSDGRRYAFNVWAFDYLSAAMAECALSGEHLAGLYLPGPDLFVERLDRPTIEKALGDWLALEGRFPAHLEDEDAVAGDEG